MAKMNFEFDEFGNDEFGTQEMIGLRMRIFR